MDAQSCLYRSIDLTDLKDDFDLIRKVTDWCDQEFRAGSPSSKRLFVGYRDGVECVRVLTQIIFGQYVASTLIISERASLVTNFPQCNVGCSVGRISCRLPGVICLSNL